MCSGSTRSSRSCDDDDSEASRLASSHLGHRLAQAPRTSSTIDVAKQLEEWPSVVQEYADHPGRESLSGNRIPRVVAARRTPTTASW